MPAANRRRDLDDLSQGPSAAQELFTKDAAPRLASSAGSGKSFADYLRTTPARPLSGMEKGILGTAGVVVGLLLVASLIRVAN